MLKYPNLFSPKRIKNTTFKNRIFSPPMLSTLANRDGYPTDYGIGFFEEKARGGAAQVTVGDSSVDPAYLRLPWAVNLHGPDAVTALRALTTAIRQHGAIASIQLNHAGSEAPPPYTDTNPAGPSAYVRPDGVQVQAITEKMMERLLDRFGRAVDVIKRAGFDMCQVHGGHGWLLHQFMSPMFNQRTDKYGGSPENRARFPIMVLDRIREVAGKEFLIEYRISGDDVVESGMRIADVIAFLQLIKDKIDIAHISVGIHSISRTNNYMFSNTYLPHGLNAGLAAAVKKAVDIPVAVVGGITDPDLAESIIAQEKADFVVMGRALVADPELPHKALTRRDDEIVPCLRCLSCLDGTYENFFECSVNPRAGKEFRLNVTAPVRRRQKVAVVGGGPGGMQAAITAAERGHDVTLWEKSSALGGNIKFADKDAFKEDLRRYKEYLVRRVNSLNIKVRLDSEATPETVAREAPDVVIAAVGAEPVVPSLAGIGNAMHALAVYAEPHQVGDRVVILGGGLAGCETSLHLARLGKRVTVVERQNVPAPEAKAMSREGLLEQMEKYHDCLDCRLNLSAVAVGPDGIRVINRDGVEQFIGADTVVYALGMKARDQLAWSFREAATFFRPAGDCVRPGKVKQAVHAGYFAALDII